LIDPISRSDKRISRSSMHASALTDWLIILRADELVSHNHDAICRTLPWEHCRSCWCRHWGMYQCRSSDIDRYHSQEERKHGDIWRGSYGTEHPGHALLTSVEEERQRRSQGPRPRRKVGFVFWTPTIVSFQVRPTITTSWSCSTAVSGCTRRRNTIEV